MCQQISVNNYKSDIWYLLILIFNISGIFSAYALEIVSVGGACNVARAARHNNVRHVAYPFDWLITDQLALKKVFQNDFSQILIPAQISLREDHKAVIDGNGLVFIHDFPTVRHQDTPTDGEIMPVHELVSNWFDSIEIVRAKFNRRLQRLQQLLDDGRPMALVRYNVSDRVSRDDAQEIIEILKCKYPKAQVVLVVIGSTDDFKEPWNLPHVCNLYLDEADLKIWNGPAWAKVIRKILSLDPQPWSMPASTSREFVLTSPCYGPGLFSVFNTVLGALDVYDRGEIAGLRIDFKNQGYYFDSNYGSNWWNYYFEPIALGKTVEQSAEKLFPTYQKIIFAYHSQFEMTRERAYELIQKYVRIKAHVYQKINDFKRQYFKDHVVVGVHYRGTDKQEATPVTYDTINQHLQKIIIAYGHQSVKIFVATDDSKFAAYIKKQFPGFVIMREALRSDNQMGVHARPDLNPYQKGEEAIIDCLLLSDCDFLIKMASNLSDCSLQFNPNLPVIKLNTSYSE